MQIQTTDILIKLCMAIGVLSCVGAGLNTFRWYVNVVELCADARQSKVLNGVHPRDDVGHTFHARYFLDVVYKVTYKNNLYSGYRVWHDRLYAESLLEATTVNSQISSEPCLLVYLPNKNPHSMVLSRPNLLKIWLIPFFFVITTVSLLYASKQSISSKGTSK